jgi:RNA polymerase sigma-70 factor (ECF subfamily)
MSDDRTLVDDVLRERPGAFARLVEAHQRLVWHILLRMVPSRQDAEDLSQECFLRVFRKLDQFRFDCALSSWIGRIAFSLGSRHLERKALPIEHGAVFEDGEAFDPLDHIADEADVAADLAEAELHVHAQRLIEALPPLQRTVLTLYHAEELGITEIARITERPEGTIKNLLFRIRLRLREALKDAIGEPA